MKKWWPSSWLVIWFRQALERKLAAKRAKLEALQAEVRALQEKCGS